MVKEICKLFYFKKPKRDHTIPQEKAIRLTQAVNFFALAQIKFICISYFMICVIKIGKEVIT